MIIVHIGPKTQKPARKDGDLHLWVGEDRLAWVLAYEKADKGRAPVFVVRRHVFVFEELKAGQRNRLRELGKLVELDLEAYEAFFNLLACLKPWSFFFGRAGAEGLLSRVTQDPYAWELLQQFAAALQQWARTWPPGEPTRAGLAALRKLRKHIWLPNAWTEIMHRVTPTEWSLPVRWIEALKA